MKQLLPIAILFSGAAIAQTQPSFTQLDTNKDGVLSQQEVISVKTLNFTTADNNGDGYLDTNEYTAASVSSGTGNTDPDRTTLPDSRVPDTTR